jgi:putative spermidine/putrescine transport system permease protein
VPTLTTVTSNPPASARAAARRPSRPGRSGVLAIRFLIGAVYVFMLSPLFFVVWLSFFADAIPTFPPSGYSLRWYVSAWRNPAFSSGFVLSVEVAVCAALISVSTGIAAAIGMSRYPFRGSAAVRAILMSPLVVPGIVAGIAIYLFMLRAENVLSVDIVGTFPALVAAHACLTIPWTLRLVSASLGGLDLMVEEAARNLGATGWIVFRRVTLPLLRPAIVASALFSFIVSFENLEVTLPLVGPGHTTLPIAIMQYLEFNLDPTIAAVSAVQILLLGVVMLVTDRFVKLSKVV